MIMIYIQQLHLNSSSLLLLQKAIVDSVKEPLSFGWTKIVFL